MKISDILKQDKQDAIKGNCKQKEQKEPKWSNPWEGMSDEEIARAKGITVKELERMRRKRARHKKNRHKRLQEKKRQWILKKINEQA